MEKRDLASQLMYMRAENESLKEQLDEYKFIIEAKNQELMELKNLVGHSGELRSKMDNQQDELNKLKDYIDRLQNIAEGASYKAMELHHEPDESMAIEQDEVRRKNIYLQDQLEDAQIRIEELENRNIKLQQQNTRIGELESLLEIAKMERDEWINKSRNRE